MLELLNLARELSLTSSQDEIFEREEEQITKVLARFLETTRTRSYASTRGKPLALTGFYFKEPYLTPFFPVQLKPEKHYLLKGWGIELNVNLEGVLGLTDNARDYDNRITSVTLYNFNSHETKTLTLAGLEIRESREGRSNRDESIIYSPLPLSWRDLYTLFHEQGHQIHRTAGKPELGISHSRMMIQISLAREDLLAEPGFPFNILGTDIKSINSSLQRKGLIEPGNYDWLAMAPSQADSDLIIEDELAATVYALQRCEEVIAGCIFDKNRRRDNELRIQLYDRLSNLAVYGLASYFRTHQQIMADGLSGFDRVRLAYGENAVEALRGQLDLVV